MSALDKQVGGGHYKALAIQPIEYIHANGLGFVEGSVVKYITRWRQKGGIQDLEKVKHFVDLLIQMETEGVPAITRKLPDPATAARQSLADADE